MKFLDPAREEARSKQEKERLTTLREDARKKQIIMGQRWNIISNEVFPDAPPRPPKVLRPRQPDSNLKYNILNNMPHGKHHTQAMVTSGG